jgi:hypothetical protein
MRHHANATWLNEGRVSPAQSAGDHKLNQKGQRSGDALTLATRAQDTDDADGSEPNSLEIVADLYRLRSRVATATTTLAYLLASAASGQPRQKALRF